MQQQQYGGPEPIYAEYSRENRRKLHHFGRKLAPIDVFFSGSGEEDDAVMGDHPGTMVALRALGSKFVPPSRKGRYADDGINEVKDVHYNPKNIQMNRFIANISRGNRVPGAF